MQEGPSEPIRTFPVKSGFRKSSRLTVSVSKKIAVGVIVQTGPASAVPLLKSAVLREIILPATSVMPFNAPKSAAGRIASEAQVSAPPGINALSGSPPACQHEDTVGKFAKLPAIANDA